MDAYILDAATLNEIGLVDQSFSSLRWTRRLYEPDTFEMVIHRRRLYASELAVGRLLFLPSEGNLCFYIEQAGMRFEGSRAGDLVTVQGRSIEGPALVKRRVVPPAGQSHDRVVSVKAETAIKHYVDFHAGPGAPATREIPNLVIAADAARGITLTAEARYQAVADILHEIGLAAAMGWSIVLNPAVPQFVFDVIVGVDRTASVFFDPAFDTLESWEELDSIADSDTTAYVGGQGEGVAREIVIRHAGGVEPSGFARREVFLDARDVDQGQTAILNQRGDSHLEATSPDARYEAKVHQFGSFRYREHWDLGDLILLRNEERGISRPARVIEVESVASGSAALPERTAVLDRPFPTLKERVTGGSAGGSAQDTPVTLPPDPHAVSHQQGGSDVVVPAVHASRHQAGGADELTAFVKKAGDALTGSLTLGVGGALFPSIAVKAHGDAGTTYPDGITLMDVSNGAGWPIQFGWAVTIRFDNAHMVQFNINHRTFNWGAPLMYARNWNNVNDAGWSAWRQISNTA